MAFERPQVFLVSELATGATKYIEVSPTDKVDDLKTLIAKYMGIPKDKQCVFVDGETLDGEYVVRDCKFPPIAPLFVMDIRKSPDHAPDLLTKHYKHD